MKKVNLTILGCAVYFSLFSGCVDHKDDVNKDMVKKTVNVKQEGSNMITTDSGLKYKVLTKGKSSQKPKTGQKVTVHYTGWLDNNGIKGSKFDSSVDRGAPFSFTIGVGQVIRGWDEGVLSMKIGEKRELIIPAELGYGSRGAGAVIPSNATLIFDVELLEIA